MKVLKYSRASMLGGVQSHVVTDIRCTLLSSRLDEVCFKGICFHLVLESFS